LAQDEAHRRIPCCCEHKPGPCDHSPCAVCLSRSDREFIVPFPGGGINDVLARILADNLAIKWSQPVVIENKTGAGGNIGAELAYQAEPDGYYGCARKCLESLSPCA
jgi:hypothetical protein